MAYLDSTTNVGNSTTPSVAVPAGVVADDIVILVASTDHSDGVFEAADWPTGFTELQESVATLDGQVAAIGWKRLTGADSGSYTFGVVNTVSVSWVCQAFAFRGRHTTNPPVATAAVNNSANGSPVSVTAGGVTAVEGDDLLWVSAPDVDLSGVVTGHAAPTNYTEKEDYFDADWSALSGATRENVSVGATGDITGTLSLSSQSAAWIAFLVRIPAAAAGGGHPAMRRFGGVQHAARIGKGIY